MVISRFLISLIFGYFVSIIGQNHVLSLICRKMYWTSLLFLCAVAHLVSSSAIEWNSIQEYIKSFQYVNAGTAISNTSVEIVPHNDQNNKTNPIFEISPLLSMFPSSPPHLGFSSDDVGDPLILTPLIENGELDKARNLSMVRCDYSEILSYTGFFTVNKKYNSNLFFWYIPAQVELKE